MGPDFEDTDLFCRVNVQAELPFEEFVSFIGRCAGGPSHMNTVSNKAFDISVFKNDDFDSELSSTGDDRWLHFRYTLEVDPSAGVAPADYVVAIGKFLKSLWSSGMDAVAASEFEEQLTRNARRLKWARTDSKGRKGATKRGGVKA